MPQRIKDQHIVIVEDDLLINSGLKNYFQEQNEVDCFTNSEDMMQAQVVLGQVDVFIIDYKLPGQNGVELFQHLRQSHTQAKFILITGEMNYEVAESTRKLGFDALILKPFDFAILEDNISTLLAATT